jgi:hypothetical protein
MLIFGWRHVGRVNRYSCTTKLMLQGSCEDTAGNTFTFVYVFIISNKVNCIFRVELQAFP